jgi:hypothetical protein
MFAQASVLAGSSCRLADGIRFNDYLSVGVIAKTFSLDQVRQVMAESGKVSDATSILFALASRQRIVPRRQPASSTRVGIPPCSPKRKGSRLTALTLLSPLGFT